MADITKGSNLSMHDIYRLLHNGQNPPADLVFSMDYLISKSKMAGKALPHTLWDFDGYTHGSSSPTPMGDNQYTSQYNNPEPTSYSAPITITAGGVYTGNWESTDSNVSPVKISTTAPVVIINSNLKANGYGVTANVAGVNVTILNTRFHGGAISSKLRRFVVLENLKNLVIENCYMESSSGIYIAGQYQGNNTVDETVRIRFNKVKNIDGRVLTGYQFNQFFQTNTFRPGTYDDIYDSATNTTIRHYHGVPHMDISWNEVVNQPGLSHVEDNINIYNTRGTTTNPIKITNNYIKGAYYWNWQGNTYSGSGMILDSPGANKGACSAYVDMEDNVVIMSNAATYGVAGGHHCNMRRNVGVSKSYIDDEDAIRLGLPTGGNTQTELKAYPATWYVDDKGYDPNYGKLSTFDNTVVDHIEGILGSNQYSVGPVGWRNDHSNVNVSWRNWEVTVTNLTILQGTINRATEDGYRQLWLNRVASEGVNLGIVMNSGI
jgi:hypothetical protein